MSEAAQAEDSRLRRLLEQALAYFQKSRFEDAWTVLNQALRLEPESFDALNLGGVAATRTGRADEAIVLLQRAIAQRPEHYGAHNNLGLALRALGRNEEAAEAYGRAVDIEPAYAAAHANRGATLADLRRYEEALACFNWSLELRPDHPDTLVRHGVVMRRLRRYQEALRSFDRAVALAPSNAEAHNERGTCLREMGTPDEAVLAHRRALALAPGDTKYLDAAVIARLRICDWAGLEEDVRDLAQKTVRGEAFMHPFPSLQTLDDAAAQLAVARNWSARQFGMIAAPAIRPAPADRIHVGYFSADFKNHPMMHLMGEMLAIRDRDRFKVTAFAFNIGQGDEYTEQARSVVDEYVDVDGISDASVAELARQRGVDIAIDRKGYTKGSRTAIFAHRAAPVQASYLAYPGTMGGPFMDYLVADRVLVPPESVGHYSEKIVWMPDSYAPRDTRVEVPTGRLKRESVGLPKQGFVYCSFNQSSKILPATFTEWMSILKQVEGSVLWLLDSGKAAADNLRREAAARGVAPERLIFAPKAPQNEHLERLRLADLCLDTLPYNAHTTANDALYVGVPIITRPGSTFASRVCASLLSTLGMPDLIAANAADYVGLAVGIGRDPRRLLDIKTRLTRAGRASPLYDMGRYVRALERAFVMMFERQQQGLPPDHLSVELP